MAGGKGDEEEDEELAKLLGMPMREVKELREVFAFFDADGLPPPPLPLSMSFLFLRNERAGSGEISMHELDEAMRRLGIQVSQARP